MHLRPSALAAPSARSCSALEGRFLLWPPELTSLESPFSTPAEAVPSLPSHVTVATISQRACHCLKSWFTCFFPHWKVSCVNAGSWPCALHLEPPLVHLISMLLFHLHVEGLSSASAPGPWSSVLAPLPASYLSLLPPRHEAQRLEQEARGRLERQKILDQSEAEKARRELLELEALRWGGELAEKMAEGIGRAADGGSVCVHACVCVHSCCDSTSQG